MTISLPKRKVDEPRARLADWQAGRPTATVREALVLAGKLRHASFVIQPGRYLICRLLQLFNLHLDGVERAGGVGACGRFRKQKEAGRGLRLSREFLADVGW